MFKVHGNEKKTIRKNKSKIISTISKIAEFKWTNTKKLIYHTDDNTAWLLSTCNKDNDALFKLQQYLNIAIFIPVINNTNNSLAIRASKRWTSNIPLFSRFYFRYQRHESDGYHWILHQILDPNNYIHYYNML